MQKIFTKFRKSLLYGVYVYSMSYCFGELIGAFFFCGGDSMLPTIQEGDVIWASRCKNLDMLKQRDIVCLVNPLEPDEYVMKRIRAIRKEKLSSPWEIEVHGDNHENSIDSRKYGPVNLALCRYKAQYRVYPWERRGWIT